VNESHADPASANAIVSGFIAAQYILCQQEVDDGSS
jgi:hypothetical protein